jgi:hypothetical protein
MVNSALIRGISACRICASDRLLPVIDLGKQSLTGRFPRACDPDPPVAPLELLRCGECGLVQLRHSVEATEMFGAGYGYRSGINAKMAAHLSTIARQSETVASLASGDTVLDIGCNDGTLLKNYDTKEIRRVGIDPIAENFRADYPQDWAVYAGFFTAERFRALAPGVRARAITSISMFYDLEDPGAFVRDIAAVMADDGLWVLEQSYLPMMLEANSYDTICHEHLEYYAFAQIEHLAKAAGLRVFDVKLNDVNGGSFQIWVCHEDAAYPRNADAIDALVRRENNLQLSSDTPFAAFRARVEALSAELRSVLTEIKEAGGIIYVYGASTKGNVLLQYMGLGPDLISGCAERNETKFGCVTPGTRIPIVPEKEARAKADYFLVLPWHFRDNFIEREQAFRAKGGKLIFPLPVVEIV